MDLSPQSLSLRPEGLRIEGPEGPVLVERKASGLAAHYQGRRLANGSARTYAEAVLAAALRIVERHSSPWTAGPSGEVRITDQERFYAETFEPGMDGLDALRSWTSG